VQRLKVREKLSANGAGPKKNPHKLRQRRRTPRGGSIGTPVQPPGTPGSLG